MQKICFATHNPNKLREVSEMLSGQYEVLGLEQIGCHEEIPETGTTLEENSLIKARHVYDNYQIDCFADDTGLEVEALGGEPGVYSARYAGEPADSKSNMNKLLANLQGQANRSARFRTVITLIQAGDITTHEGIVTGQITDKLQGKEGFGYDPIFIPSGYEQTFAEMTSADKNAISHRGRAIKNLIDYLSSQVTPQT